MKMNDLGIKKGDQNVTVGDFSKDKKVSGLAQIKSATKAKVSTPDADMARADLKTLLETTANSVNSDTVASLVARITA